MDNFTKDDLKELFEIKQWPSISVYMPTQRAGDSQQNSIRFKTLLQKAESNLSDYQFKDAGKLLAPAKNCITTPDFGISEAMVLPCLFPRMYSRFTFYHAHSMNY